MKASLFLHFTINRRLADLCAAMAVAGASISLLGFLGRFHWFLDLFSHFRVQYGLVLLIFALFLFIARRFRTALFCLLIAGLNLGQVLPLYRSSSPEGTFEGAPYRFMLLNVNTHSGNPEAVMRLLQKEQPDILLLEEISDKWVESLQGLGAIYPHQHLEPQEDNFGIGLYSRHPLKEAKTIYIGRDPLPSIQATVTLPNGEVHFLGTHPLPPVGRRMSESRNIQLDWLPDHVRRDGPFILAGDLNTTPWNFYFRKLRRESGLHDSARGFGVQPTWPQSGWLLRIPLDHCLHSRHITIQDRRIGPDVGSDHFAVIIDFHIKPSGE